MELQTISQVSQQFRISTRTLRYYEQIGLIQSRMKKDYSYRTYDENAIVRLQQIIVLRKLRIPLKSIAEILLTENTAFAIKVFQQNLDEIGDEITALTTIKNVIQSFVERLQMKNTTLHLQLLDDESLLEIVDSLTASKINFKEDKTMDDLIKAEKKLSKLTDKDVRIMYLPPASVASIHIIGGRDPQSGEQGFYPEGKTDELLREFITRVNLPTIKPDFRHYGFNHPDGSHDGGPADDHGYERWVTIPDNLEVKSPFTKKTFKGGLYAAHMIPLGAFEEWGWLWDWVHNNDHYEFAAGDPECMHGAMEEHLNFINIYREDMPKKEQVLQLDLLIPIKEK